MGSEMCIRDSYKKAKLHYEVDGMKSIDEISLEIEKIIKVKN